MFNQVTLIGNLGADPEHRQTQGGNEVCNLRIATTERYKDKRSGNNVVNTEWHQVVIWGTLAAIAAKYLHKGSMCMVQGQIKTRHFQDQSGGDRYATEIVLSGPQAILKFMPRGEGGGQRQQARQESTSQRTIENERVFSGSEDDSYDDIPF